MSISSVGTATNYSPVLEIRKPAAVSPEQRAVVEKFTASLPGNDRQNNGPEIRQVAADVESVSRTFNKKLQFVVDHQSHEVIVKVIDKTTDKVIKVIPPEELQRLHKRLEETIGFLFNERV